MAKSVHLRPALSSSNGARFRVLAKATRQDIVDKVSIRLRNTFSMLQQWEHSACLPLRQKQPGFGQKASALSSFDSSIIGQALSLGPLCMQGVEFEIIGLRHGRTWRKHPDHGGEGEVWDTIPVEEINWRDYEFPDEEDWGPCAERDNRGCLRVGLGDAPEYFLTFCPWGQHLLVLVDLLPFNFQACRTRSLAVPKKLCALCGGDVPLTEFENPCQFHPCHWTMGNDDTSSVSSSSSDDQLACCDVVSTIGGCAVEVSHHSEEEIDARSDKDSRICRYDWQTSWQMIAYDDSESGEDVSGRASPETVCH